MARNEEKAQAMLAKARAAREQAAAMAKEAELARRDGTVYPNGRTLKVLLVDGSTSNIVEHGPLRFSTFGVARWM